jgi:hypothetical protein
MKCDHVPRGVLKMRANHTCLNELFSYISKQASIHCDAYDPPFIKKNPIPLVMHHEQQNRCSAMSCEHIPRGVLKMRVSPYFWRADPISPAVASKYL